MTELLHNQLADTLGKDKGGVKSPVCLIHGQDVLVAQCCEQVVEVLLAGHQRDLCVQAMDGAAENVPNLLEELNTFSLLGGPKIVVFKEAKLFESRSGYQQLVDQIVAAFDAEEMDTAARYYLSLCSRLDLDPGEPRQGAGGQAPIKALIGELGSQGVDQLAAHCMSSGLSATISKGYVETLLQAIEKGFPPGHHLIVTVGAKVPKNLKLYKAFRDIGLVVDCNVPTGERRVDKAAQEQVLRQTADQLLAKSGKQLPGPVFQALCRLTGFDLATFVQNVKKLIDYIGDRPAIAAADLDAVLERTKVDPVYELTNAVAERNLYQSLFYASTLLGAGWHPLQILAALANQMRKLLVAKDFTCSQWGRQWIRGMAYPQFQKDIMPAIQAYDQHVRELAAAWHEVPDNPDKKAKAKKEKAPDVALAPNPGNAYPVYQTVLKSEKYTFDEILNAMGTLSQADIRLKSTGQDPAMVIKKTIMDICGQEEGRG